MWFLPDRFGSMTMSYNFVDTFLTGETPVTPCWKDWQCHTSTEFWVWTRCWTCFRWKKTFSKLETAYSWSWDISLSRRWSQLSKSRHFVYSAFWLRPMIEITSTKKCSPIRLRRLERITSTKFLWAGNRRLRVGLIVGTRVYASNGVTFPSRLSNVQGTLHVSSSPAAN